MSAREPLLPCNIFRTFWICAEVAGTKGRQTFLRAGARKGVTTAYRATSTPPTAPVASSPHCLLLEGSSGLPCASGTGLSAASALDAMPADKD